VPASDFRDGRAFPIAARRDRVRLGQSGQMIMAAVSPLALIWAWAALQQQSWVLQQLL
jgi:ABC-type uncharacterized transport system permease subunit